MDILEIIKSSEGYNSAHCMDNDSLQHKAKNLCWRFNMSSPDQKEERQQILSELLGTYNQLAFIEPSFRCDYGFNIHFHGFALVNYNCVMLDTSPVNIGAGAFIAPGVVLACAGHAIHPEQRTEGIGTSKPITIENDVWLGANVTVCGGVTIGKGSVIGAGSVVNKDIPSGVVAVGNPCRVLRKITEKDKLSKDEIFYGTE